MTSRTSEGAPRPGFRGWAGRHPTGAFLVLLFSLAYPLMALPVLADHGVIPGGSLAGKVGLEAEQLTALLMTVGVMIPTALWVTWAADGPAGVRGLLGRAFRWRFGVIWWLAVLGGLPALTIGFALLLGDSLRPVDPMRLVVSEVVGLLTAFLLINLGEETAWAGVVQTRLERFGLLAAAALTAVPFALIHMPFQFFGDFSAGSVVAGLVALLIFGAVFRLMLGVVLRGTRDSVLAVALLHTVFNRSNNTDGLATSLLDGDGRQLAALIATVVFAAAAAFVTRRRLDRGHRLALDAASAAERTRQPELGAHPATAEGDRHRASPASGLHR